MTVYFKLLDEESVRDNFVLIYELMDETLDHGYPQVTETCVLKEYIKTESNKKKINSNNTIDSKADIAIGNMLTNQVYWRKEGIHYIKNEIFMDVIERVTCLISPNCNTLRSEVRGIVQVKCNLSGMPECTLGLNDKAYLEIQGKYDDSMKNKTVEMDDLKFHPCVDMNKFSSEREITFVPPDGDFVLMKYRLDIELKPLIFVDVVINIKSETRIEYLVKARSNYKQKSIASNCDIQIPVASDIIKIDFKQSLGSPSWDSSKEIINWNIKYFQGQTECTLSANLTLPSVRIGKFNLIKEEPNKHLKKPIIVEFDIPYFTVSGILVRYLKISEKSGYLGTPWVRYMTSNGEFHIRMI